MIPKENAGEARAARTAKFGYYMSRNKVREKYNARERRAFVYALRRARAGAIVTASRPPTEGSPRRSFSKSCGERACREPNARNNAARGSSPTRTCAIVLPQTARALGRPARLRHVRRAGARGRGEPVRTAIVPDCSGLYDGRAIVASFKRYRRAMHALARNACARSESARSSPRPSIVDAVTPARCSRPNWIVPRLRLRRSLPLLRHPAGLLFGAGFSSCPRARSPCGPTRCRRPGWLLRELERPRLDRREPLLRIERMPSSRPDSRDRRSSGRTCACACGKAPSARRPRDELGRTGPRPQRRGIRFGRTRSGSRRLRRRRVRVRGSPECGCGEAALLRAAAGDLRRVTGWLPPRSARICFPKVPCAGGGVRFSWRRRLRPAGNASCGRLR